MPPICGNKHGSIGAFFSLQTLFGVYSAKWWKKNSISTAYKKLNVTHVIPISHSQPIDLTFGLPLHPQRQLLPLFSSTTSSRRAV